MKYKYANEAKTEFCTVKDGVKSQSWNRKNKPGYAKEMDKWVETGNEIEPFETEAETEEREAKETSTAYDSFILQRNTRILEADKWELSTIQKRYNITQEQVEEYKQFLCDMPNTLTIESTLEELQNPAWPTKLIEGLL